MARRSNTVQHAEWVPTSHATAPAAYPPHPPMASSGRYRESTIVAPGLLPVRVHVEKSIRLAVTLSLLFGPLGLWYLSTGAGLTATVLAAAIVAGAGLPALLLLWPLSVAVAVWLVRSTPSGPAAVRSS